MKINREMVDVFPAKCHKDYTSKNYVGGVRIKYLKQVMWLVDKYKVKDSKVLKIFVVKGKGLMPLYVETNDKKKWILIAPCVPVEKNKGRFK